MTNDQFFLFPILSYGNKNTVGAVARLFFSDPPLTPHATYSLNNEQLPRTREASVVGNWRRASNFCNPVRLPPCSSGSPPPRVVKNYEYCNIDKCVPPTPTTLYRVVF